MTRVVRAGHPRTPDRRYAYIGRPSKWGNPFRIGPDGNRAEVIRRFREYWNAPAQAPLRWAARRELTDTDLGCYCTPAACHGDVIAEYVNQLEEGSECLS